MGAGVSGEAGAHRRAVPAGRHVRHPCAHHRAGLTKEWGQPVIVDNRPGAAGNIAAEHVARSPGDGYTLFITTVGIHAIHPSLYSKLPFDAIRDFTPITNLVMLPTVLTVHPSIPVRSVKELIALAKKRPGDLTTVRPAAAASRTLPPSCSRR